MALTKAKKVELVGELDTAIKGANSLVFVSFDRLSVADANSLRKDLRGESVGYKVAKKTLMKRALDAGKFVGVMPELPGEIALAYGTDAIAPARGVYNFQMTHKDNIKIVGGVFEGKYMNAEEMMGIATIPPLQVLRGMFVNVINSPIQGLVLALNAVAEKKSA